MEAAMSGQESVHYQTRQGGVVGGKAADPAKAAEIARETAKLARADGKNDHAVVVNGQVMTAAKGLSENVVNAGQKDLNLAESAIESMNYVLKRIKQPGGVVPGDPQIAMESAMAINPILQLVGGGVASESDKADFKDAAKPGPRQAGAMERLLEKAISIREQRARALGLKPQDPDKPQRRYTVGGQSGGYLPPRGPLAAQQRTPGPLAPQKKAVGPLAPLPWEQGLDPAVQAILAPAGSISEAEGRTVRRGLSIATPAQQRAKDQ
jgi:hypothetical protein